MPVSAHEHNSVNCLNYSSFHVKNGNITHLSGCVTGENVASVLHSFSFHVTGENITLPSCTIGYCDTGENATCLSCITGHHVTVWT